MNTAVTEGLKNPIAYQDYRKLSADMFMEASPTPSPTPALIELNNKLLDQLGIDSSWFLSEQGISILAGSAINTENPPIAMAYSAHQFGQWVPLLGDGRAHMLGQMKSSDGTKIDVQLKGSGMTQFSRGGDGRATLGSVLREYLVSEAMAGLGIPTTRSLAVLTTGSVVPRERAFPGAILVRTATSHLRVGSFEYATSKLGVNGVQSLADFIITRHFPDLESSPSKYLELFSNVIERQASLIAQWMLVGFIHGVMNTDNTSIVGETIDYGPCAFMDEFNPGKVFSSIDHNGRYAWNQQPSIAYWNLAMLANTMLALFDATPDHAVTNATERLERFDGLFRDAFEKGMHKKLGLDTQSKESGEFISNTLTNLTNENIDFTVFFDRLTDVANSNTESQLLELFTNQQTGSTWLEQWHKHRTENTISNNAMRLANPIVIARNHRVEQVIDAAVDHNDFEPFQRLSRVLANPFEIDPADRELEAPPQPEERVLQTYCGT